MSAQLTGMSDGGGGAAGSPWQMMGKSAAPVRLRQAVWPRSRPRVIV